MPRLPLSEISEQFAKSREQSGLSPHYVFLCRKFTRKLAEAFPGLCLSDLTTAALDQWWGAQAWGHNQECEQGEDAPPPSSADFGRSR